MVHLQEDKLQFFQLRESFNVYQIFSYYFILLHPFCVHQFLFEYFVLLVMLAMALNKFGWNFIKTEEQVEKTDFCSQFNISLVPEIFNIFLAEIFPVLMKEFQKEQEIEFHFLGDDEKHILNLVYMLKLLANWLYDFNFTQYKLEINFEI